MLDSGDDVLLQSWVGSVLLPRYGLRGLYLTAASSHIVRFTLGGCRSPSNVSKACSVRDVFDWELTFRANSIAVLPSEQEIRY
jgi:hypothetical protein